MNILVFSTVFYPAIGGLENQTLILLKEFTSQGHTVKVITDQKQTHPLQEIEVYESPGWWRKIRLFWWCHVYYMPNISLKGVWLLLLNAFLAQKKKWIVSHNDFYLENRKSPFVRLKRQLIRYAYRNIAVSSSVAGYINTPSTVIYNCYDESVFRLYTEENRSADFVFLGRLVSQKGCDVLIRACQRLRPPFSLTIIGEGPEEKYLKELTASLELSASIRFAGSLRGTELARMLNRHRVMIVPAAQSEGFGIVVLEGLACGCKIIASDAAGLVEAVNQHGAIFPMNDVEQLATLMQYHLDHQQEASISNALQLYLEQQTRQKVSGKYLCLFLSSEPVPSC